MVQSRKEEEGTQRSRENPPVEPSPGKLVIRGQASGRNQLLAGRGGVNLQQEVAPHQTERPPRDSPERVLPNEQAGAKVNIQADRGLIGDS